MKPPLDVCSAYSKVMPHFPENLASKSQIKKLQTFQRTLPPAFLTTFYGFETTLTADEKWVDVAFYSVLSKKQLEALKSYWQEEDIGRKIKESALWKLCFECLLKIKEQKRAKDRVDGAWLCFDLGSDAIWPPQPNLYLSILKNHKLSEVVDELVFLIHKKPLPLINRQRIAQFFNQCRLMNVRPAYLGFMLARDSRDIRFYLTCDAFRNPTFLEEFLIRVKCADNYKRFVELIKKLPSCVEKICLLLDYATGVNPRMGMELHVKEAGILKRKKYWESLLDFLVSENLLCPKKRAAVFTWIGAHKAGVDKHVFMPTYDYFFRDINHIKIVNCPDMPLEAKAYLRVSYKNGLK